jgi:hypothetical protein
VESKGIYSQTGGQARYTSFVNVNNGLLELQNGYLRARGQRVYEGGRIIQTGGTSVATELLEILDGTYTLAGGSLMVGRLTVGSETESALRITDPASTVLVAVGIRFEGLGHADTGEAPFQAPPGTTIRMTGSWFENEVTDPDRLADLANVHLLYEDRRGMIDDFEVAAMDFGRSMVGYHRNFVIDTITLSETTTIRLIDGSDNGNRNGPEGFTEALYVRRMVVGEEATVDLNGRHIYVQELVNEGTVINGELSSMMPGDATGDFRVDFADFQALQNHWGTLTASMADGDFNGDVTVDFADFQILQNHWGAEATALAGLDPGASTVPEPGTLLLLAAGAGLAAVRRRRARRAA